MFSSTFARKSQLSEVGIRAYCTLCFSVQSGGSECWPLGWRLEVF